MQRLIETFVLYLALTALAIGGLTYLVPKASTVLSERLERATQAGLNQ